MGWDLGEGQGMGALAVSCWTPGQAWAGRTAGQHDTEQKVVKWGKEHRSLTGFFHLIFL